MTSLIAALLRLVHRRTIRRAWEAHDIKETEEFIAAIRRSA